jgi:hypothetical protein
VLITIGVGSLCSTGSLVVAGAEYSTLIGAIDAILDYSSLTKIRWSCLCDDKKSSFECRIFHVTGIKLG